MREGVMRRGGGKRRGAERLLWRPADRPWTTLVRSVKFTCSRVGGRFALQHKVMGALA